MISASWNPFWKEIQARTFSGSLPGHEHRLLEIIEPDHLFMGQKDYQQCMVIKKLLEIIQSPIKLHTCPTMREPDGLAMSSRNMRLTAD